LGLHRERRDVFPLPKPAAIGYTARVTFGVSMGPEGSADRWVRERRLFRRGTGSIYRKLQSIKFLFTRDLSAVSSFLRARYPIELPLERRIDLLRRFTRITNAVRGYHTLAELLTVSDRILRIAPLASNTRRPVIVEAGAGSGSSTAKLSLVTRMVGGRLHVFDTFRGIPENDEKHRMLDGRELVFRRGAFRGRLSSVKSTVERFGAMEVCTFHKGLFEETLAELDEVIDVALLDVDLIASTRTCLKRLYPRLAMGGVILSQDGHLQAIVELLSSPDFWTREVGAEPPAIAGLGTRKLIEIEK
jgi:O-methyltransferase